jgi:hypothetical protein
LKPGKLSLVDYTLGLVLASNELMPLPRFPSSTITEFLNRNNNGKSSRSSSLITIYYIKTKDTSIHYILYSLSRAYLAVWHLEGKGLQLNRFSGNRSLRGQSLFWCGRGWILVADIISYSEYCRITFEFRIYF